MLPYILLLILILLFRAIFGSKQSSQRGKRIFLIWALLPFFLLLAFRGPSVGADTANYTDIFNDIKLTDTPRDVDERVEIGYLYFSKAIATVFNDVQWLFIITALVATVCIGRFIYQNAKDPALVLFLFVTLGLFQFMLSGVRQSIAVSITLWLYPYIKQKKLLPFLIGLAIAALFHKSALLFLPAYIMARQKISPFRIFLELLGFFVIFMAADKLLLMTASLMEYNYGIEETNNGYIFFIIVLLITLAGSLNHKHIIKQNPDNTSIINLNYISFVLWGIRLTSRTAERVAFYYMPYTCILLEEYVMSKKRTTKHLLYITVVILSSSLFLYRVYYAESLNPYLFFFE